MKPKSLLLIILALGCGLVASIGISQVMERNRNAAPEEQGEKVQVFVAKQEIPAGETIKADHLKLQTWPKDMVPSDAITDIKNLEGKKPHQKILENELMREARFKEGETGRRPIPVGFRVVTVKVNAEKGGHLVGIGDKVDLQVYIRPGVVPDVTQPTTKTFLRNVEVFAVGTMTRRAEDGTEGNSNAQTISLLVTPKQSDVVTLAQRVGEVSLVLKNDSDTATNANDRGVGGSDLFRELIGEPNPPVAATTPTPADTKPSTGIVDYIGGLKNAVKSSGKPHIDEGFVMLEISGNNLTQYSFGDPKKPPVSSAQAGGTNGQGGLPGQPASHNNDTDEPQDEPTPEPTKEPAATSRQKIQAPKIDNLNDGKDQGIKDEQD